MTEADAQAPLNETLKHELGNALMTVLSFAEAIDRQSPDNPVIHDAVDRIKQAVVRADDATQHVAREIHDIARRLSR